MLKLKYLYENYSLAKEALKNWDYDTNSIDDMLEYFRISSNAVYPFCQNGTVCFLRLAPVGEKLEHNIVGEMEYIRYLREHEYPAMEPVLSKTGESCLKLHTQWGNYYATAFQRVKGVQLEDTELSEKMILEYGKALGKLHALASEYVPKTKKWTHQDVMDWMESVLKEYHAPEMISQALLSLKNELKNCPMDQKNYGLIHYDFELDNVFYDRENECCTVIDFDDGMYHWYVTDIEQVFESLAEKLSGEKLDNAKEIFLNGYRMEYDYTEEMEAMRPLTRQFADLYHYSRLIRSVAEQGENEPDWMLSLREKLNHSITEKQAAIIKRYIRA